MKISASILGILVGTVAVFLLWPEVTEKRSITPDAIPTTVRKLVSSRPLFELLDDCRNARSNRETFMAYRRFTIAAEGRFPEALDLIEWDNSSWDLKPEIHALLLAWGESDPQAALEWSWEHFCGNRKWEKISNDILDAWIARGDHSALDFLADVETWTENLTEQEAKNSPAMRFNESQMMYIAKRLYFYDGAFVLSALERGFRSVSWWPRPANFVDRLNSRKEIATSLEMWKDIKNASELREQMRSRGREFGMTFPEKTPQVNTDILRDDQPFRKQSQTQVNYWGKARINLTEAITEAAALDAPARRAAYLTMYDSWSLAHPEETPNYDSLPTEVRELWRDLSKLGPINDDGRIDPFSEEWLQESSVLIRKKIAK